MMMKQAVWGLVVAAACLAMVEAADKAAEAADKTDKTSVAATTTAADEASSSYLPMLYTGGAAAAGVLALALVVSLAMQLLGLKTCHLVGNCEPSGYAASTAATTAYQNDPYYSGQAQGSQYSYPSAGTTYQKRSVDYVGPVINMLRSAYEKYGQNTLPLTNKKLS